MKKLLTTKLLLSTFLFTTTAYAFTEDEYRRVAANIMELNRRRHIPSEMIENRNPLILEIANYQRINPNDVREILADLFPPSEEELAIEQERQERPARIEREQRERQEIRQSEEREQRERREIRQSEERERQEIRQSEERERQEMELILSDPYKLDLIYYSIAKINNNEEEVNDYLIKTSDDNYVENCTDITTKLNIFSTYLTSIDDESLKTLDTLEISQVQTEKEVINNVITNINNRLDNISFFPLGISSGDNDNFNGYWVSGLYNQIEQKTDKTNLGYKEKLFGPSIGLDTNITENTLFGTAYSYIQSDIKYSKNSQQTIATSHALSLYTQSQINDFLWNNIFSVSTGNVTKKINRQILPSVFKRGSAKTYSKSISFDSSLGYKIHITNTNLTIVPQISGRYAGYKEAGYKEKGFGIQNKTYGEKSTQSLLGTLGVKFISRNKISEDTELMPSFDLSVENEFVDKKSKINSKYSVVTEKIILTSSNSKKDSLKYNVGLSTLFVHKNFEMNVAYNCSFQKKYQNHQGYLKFKLLF